MSNAGDNNEPAKEFEDEDQMVVTYNEEKFEDDFEEASPPASPKTDPKPTTNEAPPAAAAPAAAAPAASTPTAAPAASAPAVTLDIGPPETVGGPDALDKAMSGGNSQTQPSKSPSKINENKELKERTTFSNQTNDGVLKRTTFIHKLSGYPAAPEVSIASRGENMFSRSSMGPSPGTYQLPPDSKTKFKSSTCASFGGSSRFGLGTSPTKIAPGPGQYQPRDPSLFLDAKVGFGTSVRNKNSLLPQNPGPGAYECRSTVGGGMMFTARGRQPTSYMRSRSMPGPGAYQPSMNGAYMSSPKPGFGSSVRGDIAGGGPRGQPGPGTYEMQNFKCLGKESCKYSATSRRRMHDLSSYTTPGPGTYNAHATSFGSPGAYSCQHVDEGYKRRNALNASQTH